jgi:hypothetical protein
MKNWIGESTLLTVFWRAGPNHKDAGNRDKGYHVSFLTPIVLSLYVICDSYGTEQRRSQKCHVGIQCTST